MKQNEAFLPNLTKDVVAGVKGFKLDAYLLALEGWRRGLELTWYKDETDHCHMYKTESTTHGRFFSLSNGNQIHYFYRSRGDLVANETARMCQDKGKTKMHLSKMNVPVPVGDVFKITEVEEIILFAQKLGYPVIIKPLNGSMGKGVHTDIQNELELREIMNELQSQLAYKRYIVEKHYHGNEFRIYVVGEKVIGATNRVPANIIGDGKNTISQLIKKKNSSRRKNPYLMAKPIKIDFEVKSSLQRLGYTLDSVPTQGEQIFLRTISNLSTGGDPMDATNLLTPEVKQIAVDALKALPSIPHAGVDIIIDEKDNRKGVVLEINPTAEIAFHMFPLEGKSRDVCAAIIDYYFPDTVDQPKSIAYFNYNSVLEPLMSWATEKIAVSRPILGELYGKRYIVSGKVQRVGYMTWIRKMALKQNIFGYAKKVGRDIEVAVIGTDRVAIDEFIKTCYKGSKNSKVEQVQVKDLDVRQPFEIGFQVLTTPDVPKKQVISSVAKQQASKTILLQKLRRLVK